MYKRFLRSVLPSMLAFVFSGLYTIIDGLFVGRSIGDTGLAAITIAYPLAALVQAAGTGIGMGGAVHLSLRRGKGDAQGERRYLGGTLGLLCLAGAALAAGLFLLHRPLLRLLGAEGAVLEGGCAYLHIIIGGSLLQLFATGCTPLLRNYNASVLAMGAMIAGFVTNIALDYLFIVVLSWGMAGAALATVLGQAVTVAPCLIFLGRRAKGMGWRDIVPTRRDAGQMLRTGLSPFGLAMSPNLTLAMMNRSAAAWGGATAVAAYAVVAYVTAVVQLLLQGVGDGSQPLMSMSLGGGQFREVRKVRDLSYLTALLTALLNVVLMFALGSGIPRLFGASPAAGAAAAEVLPLFAAGCVFSALSRVTTSYFYSVRENASAYVLVYGEPLLTCLLLTAGLPRLMGLWGVWWSVPAAQALLLLPTFFLLWKKRRKDAQKNTI